MDFQAIVNAGMLDDVEATIALGTSAQAAKKWWLGEISRIANEREVEPRTLLSPEQVAQLENTVQSGVINDKIAREVLSRMINGEGTPEEIIEQNAMAVVSDDSALLAAIDEALASDPDVMQRIQEGKVQAAGAVIGQVMKALGGQADAKRVRELILERAGQTG
jgi:aspartyl-tRNA(Asn)/glutamyl-tRNA(Gln) amidotransferase subunit B